MLRKRRFSQMYHTYSDDIYRYHYSYVQDVPLAEDLTAETFTKAWAKIDSFDFKEARPWLYKIAKNTLTDHWRKNKPLALDDSIEIEDDSAPIEDIVDAQLSADKLLKALNKLPDEMRSVVTMRFQLGYSVRKTAQSLGISEANVRVIQYRALKKLRGHLS